MKTCFPETPANAEVLHLPIAMYLRCAVDKNETVRSCAVFVEAALPQFFNSEMVRVHPSYAYVAFPVPPDRNRLSSQPPLQRKEDPLLKLLGKCS